MDAAKSYVINFIIYEYTMSNDDIFLKHKTRYNITSKDILSKAPEDSFTERQEDLAKTKVEWRWRVLNINDKTYVEVSKRSPDGERLYFNPSNLKLVKRNVSKRYDEFVKRSLYAYVNE